MAAQKMFQRGGTAYGRKASHYLRILSLYFGTDADFPFWNWVWYWHWCFGVLIKCKLCITGYVNTYSKSIPNKYGLKAPLRQHNKCILKCRTAILLSDFGPLF